MPPRGLKIKLQDAPRLKEMLRWFKARRRQIEGAIGLLRTIQLRSPRLFAERIRYYNDSGEKIPPYGCMAVTDKKEIDGRLYHKVTKPSTTFRRQYIPNGSREIEIAGTGSIPVHRYYRWLYTGSSPTNGNGYGPTPDQWHLSLNYPAVTEVAYDYDATADVLLGTLMLIDRVVIKNSTGSSIGANTSGNFTVQQGAAGSEASAGYSTVSMRNRGSIAFANSKIGAGVVLNGQWYAMPWECP